MNTVKHYTALVLFFISMVHANAQWNPSGATPSQSIYRTGITGVGPQYTSGVMPLYRLSLGNDVANTKIALYDGIPNSPYGIGIQAAQFRFHLDASTARFSFLSAPTGTELFTIKGTGEIGIGVSNPSFKLQVNGTAQMTGFKLGTTTTAGYVLTADADGNGTWQQATGGGVNGSWTVVGNAQYSNTTGSVGIGITSPLSTAKLHVNGAVLIGDGTVTMPSANSAAGYNLYVQHGILTEKIKVSVKNTASWADFVFDKSYQLMPLADVAKFVDENNHLPDVPSAEAMVSEGLDVAAMDAKLLQKIEELTLYMIQMENKMNEMKKENEELRESIELLK